VNVIVVSEANDRPAEPQVRVSNAEARARAWRFIGFGDTHFSAQRFRDANQRYRSAAEAAPDLVEAHFRQAQALVATGQFDLAARTFKRGMALGPGWPQADFSLTELYGENRLAKTSHLERLALAAEAEPENADLLLVVGMQLYFDGQQERAAPFFRQAATQLADAGLHLDKLIAAPAADPQPVVGF
jgi:tetratricopeptide (TPR) repeat protein